MLKAAISPRDSKTIKNFFISFLLFSCFDPHGHGDHLKKQPTPSRFHTRPALNRSETGGGTHLRFPEGRFKNNLSAHHLLTQIFGMTLTPLKGDVKPYFSSGRRISCPGEEIESLPNCKHYTRVTRRDEATADGWDGPEGVIHDILSKIMN